MTTLMYRAPGPLHADRPAEQNGIKAPVRDGAIMDAWRWFDSATGPILCAHLPRLAQETGLNLGNLQIELRRWKRFNGIPTGERTVELEAA